MQEIDVDEKYLKALIHSHELWINKNPLGKKLVLSGVKIQNMDLSKVVLNKAEIHSSLIVNVSFEGAILNGTLFNSSKMENVFFDNTQVSKETSLFGCIVTNSSFKNIENIQNTNCDTAGQDVKYYDDKNTSLGFYVGAPQPLSFLNKKDLNKDYPHKCPKCGNPAFISFTSVDCSRSCR